MSVTVMSLVFSYNMPDLKTDKGDNVPDNTAKFVLLALADHCNDEGEAAYPSIDTLCKKTSMSRETVCKAVNALRSNGFTTYEGESKRHTSNYSIMVAKLRISPIVEPVRPANFAKFDQRTDDSSTVEHESSSQPSIKPSSEKPKIQLPPGSGVDWQLAGGVEASEIARSNEKVQRERAVADLWEKVMGYNPLPWWSEKDLKALLVFLLGKTSEEMEVFANWSRGKYSPLSPVKARAFPRQVIELWPQAFAAKEAEPSYYKRPAVLDEDESNYVIPD